jgi:protein O-mannosyl-transferase
MLKCDATHRLFCVVERFAATSPAPARIGFSRDRQPRTNMEPATGQARYLLVLKSAVIVLATWIAYLPALQCEFIWDDDDYVVENNTLRDTAGLWAIWTDPSATPQYYPLVHSTFWLEYQTWGLSAGGYHATNIFIHMLNALLLWWLLVRLGVPTAWLAALVFAVHPVHVESVAWITERKNVLSGLFYFLSIHAYLHFWDFTKPVVNEADLASVETTTGKRRWLAFAGANLFFVAALLSKTVTSTLPAAILVLVWWKQGFIPIRKSLSLAPMLIIGFVFGLFTIWLEKFQVGASGVDWDLSFMERWLIAGRALWFYAGKLIWPAELIFTYPRWDIDASQWWQFLFPLAAFLVIGLAWHFRQKVGRGPLAAILLFAGTLFPALGFFDVYPMRFSFVADHFQYLASVALIVLYVAAAAKAFTSLLSESPLSQRFASLALATLLGYLTWHQTLIYEGLEPLWRDTLAKNSESFMAHNNLAALLNRRGDYEEAEAHLRESMRIKPGFVDSIVNMGKAREGQGDIDAALKYYQEATELSPGLATAWNSLGAMHGAKGDLMTAERYFLHATKLQPDYVSAHLNLGALYVAQQKWASAVEHFERVRELQPDLTAARDSLANAYLMVEDFDAAELLLKEILSEQPDNIPAIGALGVMAAKQQRYRTAIHYFEQLLSLEPNEPNALAQLIDLHRQVGENEKADEYQSRLPKP